MEPQRAGVDKHALGENKALYLKGQSIFGNRQVSVGYTLRLKQQLSAPVAAEAAG